MELGRLRIFVTAVRSGSFSQAALRLYVSHSTVSRAVAALEKELGVCLVERGSHEFTLTQAGEKLLVEAEALLKSAAEAAERVREAAK